MAASPFPFVLLAALLAAPVHAGQVIYEKPMSAKAMVFRVTIDERGEIASALPMTASTPEDVVRAIFAAAKQQLRFEPARVDGKPAPSETFLQLSARFVVQPDRSFRAELKSARLGPLPVGTNAVSYSDKHPRSATGIVLASVSVGADGKVEAAKSRVLQTATSKNGRAHAARFGQDVLASVADWNFEPDRVAGKPVASEAVVMSRFCTTDCTVPAEPEPTAEQLALPRSLTPGVELARIRR